MEARLDRIIELAESVLRRLQTDEKLSTILPQARLLAEINGDPVEAAWLDNEIHGIGMVPLHPEEHRTSEERRGVDIFQELHRTTEVQPVPTPGGAAGDPHAGYGSIHFGISILEHLSITEHPQLRERVYAFRSESERGSIVKALEADRIINCVRSKVYDYVGKVWVQSTSEKQNQALLGPDYGIVINNLDALETGVGQELGATLANLRETNPASWSLAALGCRNVILKLGSSLWKGPCEKYLSELEGRELELAGEKEKNKVLAYIDYHHQRVAQREQKDILKQLYNKVGPIYEVGSKGKRGTAVRHQEAKDLVVDTFEFVSQLDAITGLTPLEAA